MKTSDLILTGNIVTRNLFAINQNIDFDQWNTDNVKFQLKKTFGIASDDSSNVRLILDAKLFDDDFEKNGEPFFLNVEMNFFFNVTSDEKFEGNQVLDKYAYSMMGIAFPYIRAFISSFSGLIGMKNVVNIPAIDVASFFDEN